MTPEQQAAQEKRYATYQERMKAIDAKYPGATLKDFVDHIDHAVKVAGIDHVGIGTDFDGGGGIPGFNDHSEALNVTVELVKRGYSEEQIVEDLGRQPAEGVERGGEGQEVGNGTRSCEVANRAKCGSCERTDLRSRSQFHSTSYFARLLLLLTSLRRYFIYFFKISIM